MCENASTAPRQPATAGLPPARGGATVGIAGSAAWAEGRTVSVEGTVRGQRVSANGIVDLAFYCDRVSRRHAAWKRRQLSDRVPTGPRFATGAR
jgi:hypothetical protein